MISILTLTIGVVIATDIAMNILQTFPINFIMSFELISSFNLIWLFLFIIKSNWFYTWSHFCLFSFKLKTCPFHPWFQYELTEDGVTESTELWNIPVVGFAELEDAVTLTLWVTVVSSASIFFTVEVFSRIMKLTIFKKSLLDNHLGVDDRLSSAKDLFNFWSFTPRDRI